MWAGMPTLLQTMTDERVARLERLRLTVREELRRALGDIVRLYNVFEKILERLCRGFENHFDERDDYHERLIQRLALALPGIRPAFIPQDALRNVRELKGFRHLVRHAYDLEFRARSRVA